MNTAPDEIRARIAAILAELPDPANVENMPAADRTALKRHIGSASIKEELDSAKRIVIPAEMADAVGIGGEAVFAGMLDYFEIWSKDRYADMHSLEKRVVANALKSLE